MDAATLKDLLERRPFEPFELHMSNGEVFQVRYPGNALVLKTKLAIADPEADKIAILSLPHIASLHTPQ